MESLYAAAIALVTKHERRLRKADDIATVYQILTNEAPVSRICVRMLSLYIYMYIYIYMVTEIYTYTQKHRFKLIQSS